jgi:hypothetical protein
MLPAILSQPIHGAKFELHMVKAGQESGVIMQTGIVDAFSVGSSGPSEIELRGRDMIAPLFNSFFLADRAFDSVNYYDITAEAMKIAGMDPANLVTGPGARDSIIGGVKKAKARKPSTDAKSQIVQQTEGNKTRVVYNTIKADVGSNLYQWLKDQYKKSGLFLWSAPNGKLVLSAPNANVIPQFKITRKLSGQTSTDVNIEAWDYGIDYSGMHSHVYVYGRAGGGKDGRRRIGAVAVDQRLLDAGLQSRISYEDDVRTQKEAEYLAKRYAIEETRNGLTIEYTLSGHSAPSQVTPGVRLPWTIDEIVAVDDEWLGIKQNLYIGDVTYTRDAQGTRTTIKLYRPRDLVFAENAQ